MRTLTRMIACIVIGVLLVGCSLQTGQPTGKSTPTGIAAQPEVIVYVSGQVAQPGTYRVAKGSSLSAAVAAAGGLTPQADVTALNLGQVLDSTVQLYIPAIGETKAGQPEAKRAQSSLPSNELVVAESSPPPAPPGRQPPVYRPGGSVSELERQMLDMINTERSSRGLKILVLDDGLVKTARMKSQDMIDNSYFDHSSPKWGTMSELLASQGVTYRLAGENLAISGKLEQAHRGLMNSPGHRMNLLNPPYTRIGIGIIQDPHRGLVITQHFAG